MDHSRTNGRIVLSAADFDRLVEELENPRPPTEALIKARQRYVELKKQEIQDNMDKHMVETSSAKKL